MIAQAVTRIALPLLLVVLAGSGAVPRARGAEQAGQAGGEARGEPAVRRFTMTLDGAASQVTVVGATLGGVLIESGSTPGVSARRVLVSWDLIDPEIGLRLAAESSVPEGWVADLWRARGRVERGDWPGAEPIVERAMGVLELGAVEGAGERAVAAERSLGPTHALVAKSALYGRMKRGAHASALRAYFLWLETVSRAPAGWLGADGMVRSSAPGLEWMGGVVDVAGVIDERWGLCPELPPVFIADPAKVAMARQWVGATPGDGDANDYAREMVAWYVAAMRHEAGMSVEMPAGASRGGTPASVVRGVAGVAGGPAESLRLVREVVQARIGEGTDRASARAALSARIDREETPAWVEAWCRAGIGRSLVVEQDERQVRAGVIELLHVPARFSRQTPHLSALALAEAAVAMDRLGDTASAGLIRGELVKRHPGHPAVNWASAQPAGRVR